MVARTASTSLTDPDELASLCLAITEHAPLPMATVEGATHIVRYVNPAFRRLMDKPSEQLVGRPLYELLPEKDKCITLLDRVFQSGRPESYTEKDPSRPHPVFWSYTVWPLLANEPFVGVMIQVTETARGHEQMVAMNEALVLGSVRQHELRAAAEALNEQLRVEIAERRQAAEELRASEVRFRTMFEMGPVAVYSCDSMGMIQEFNRRSAELWGRRPALGDTDALFCGSYKLFRPDGSVLTHDQSPMAQVVMGKLAAAHDAEIMIQRPDGSMISVVVNVRPLKNERGEITGAINCFYDISERKLFEDEREAHLINEQALRLEAEAANRSKDLFLATLSHEVRTPLNAILGWATILRGGNCTAEDVREGMEVIERNCRAQAQLIEDVLDISRIVSGKLNLEIRPCELIDIIKAAMDVVRPAAEAKGIRIQTAFDSSASHASCDRNRMQQVVWNLLSNAIKFSPKGKVMRVTLAPANSGARIQISDEGQGITAEFLPFVFDRFRQADGGTQRRYGGLGLGLSIVKHIVELHGGTVHAASAGEGRGATFTVDLPVRAVQVEGGTLKVADFKGFASVPLPEVIQVRLDGLRVLVVDDQPDARRLVSRVLQEAGASVTTASSAAEALLAVTTTNPEVLLSDIAMPDQDGYDLIRKVRAGGRTPRELPAVALTAFAHKDDRLRALLAGFQVHVAKPIDPHELITVIASLAGRTG